MSRGLTLVELVITIFVAGVLGVPTGLLITEHLRAAMSAHESGVASQLARAELERLDSLNDFFAPDLALGTTVLATYQGAPYNLTRQVTCQAGNCVSLAFSGQGIKRIQITVTPAGSTTRLISLISYRTKHVGFGS